MQFFGTMLGANGLISGFKKLPNKKTSSKFYLKKILFFIRSLLNKIFNILIYFQLNLWAINTAVGVGKFFYSLKLIVKSLAKLFYNAEEQIDLFSFLAQTIALVDESMVNSSIGMSTNFNLLILFTFVFILFS